MFNDWYLDESTKNCLIEFITEELVRLIDLNKNDFSNGVYKVRTEYIDSLPNGLDSFVGERGVNISGGQRQRIGIARALYNDPNILVLDEATSSLDGNTEKGLMDAVNALQGIKTIIIVAHRLSTIENCEYIYKLEKGKIVNKGSNLGEIV